MAAALREAAEQAGIDAGELDGIGVGSPGRRRRRHRHERAQPARAGKARSRSPSARRAARPPVRLGNDVQVATIAEVELGRRAACTSSLLGVFWGTGVGGCPILDGGPWRGRGGAGEIGHMVVEIDGARCTCGRRGCMEAYAGRAAMEMHVRKLVEKGEKTDLFKLMKHHDRDAPDERRVGARARARRQARRCR